MQAPGVPGSKGGLLAATVEAEVGRGRRQGSAAAAAQEEEEEDEPIILDDLFRKTEAKPSLYWLPLSEEEVRWRGSVESSGGGGSVERGMKGMSCCVLLLARIKSVPCVVLCGFGRAGNLRMLPFGSATYVATLQRALTHHVTTLGFSRVV